MKKSYSQLCICCARTMGREHYTRDSQICDLCMALPVADAVKTALATKTRQLQTEFGAVKLNRAEKQARYLLIGKVCGACHHAKPPNEYHACASRGDGLNTICKACVSVQYAFQRSAQPRAVWYAYRDALRAQAATNAATPKPPPAPDSQQ